MRPDPGLNIYVRQPIPSGFNLPWRMEATADLRNMLAQGYLPLSLADGRRILLIQNLTKAVEQLLALLLAPGELVRRHHHRVARAVVDQDLAGAVDDPPARRLDVDVAHAVVVRFRAVAVAGEDLEVPQPEEDDPEQNEGDAADDRHAKGELRRDGRASLAIEIHRLVAPSPRPNARRSHSRPPVPGGQ